MSDKTVRTMALVVNSQSGSSDIDLSEISDLLTEGGVTVTQVEVTEDALAVPDLARRAAETAEVVAIGGGDGTLSLSLPVFVETGRMLGVLPLGTANDLARSLDIPDDPVAAARVLLSGKARRIDLGEINGRLFCNAVSVGFPADLANQHAPARKKWLGVLEYPLLWARTIRAWKPLNVTLDHDGETERIDSVFMLTVMNGRYHGRGMTVDEAAQIDDGVFKVYCVEYVEKWKLLATFLSLQRGRLSRERHTKLFRARTVEIFGDRPLPVNIDGDVSDETPAELRILPKAITAITPRAPTGLG